jgi:hypothetical protein
MAASTDSCCKGAVAHINTQVSHKLLGSLRYPAGCCEHTTWLVLLLLLLLLLLTSCTAGDTRVNPVLL